MIFSFPGVGCYGRCPDDVLCHGQCRAAWCGGPFQNQGGQPCRWMADGWRKDVPEHFYYTGGGIRDDTGVYVLCNKCSTIRCFEDQKRMISVLLEFVFYSGSALDIVQVDLKQLINDNHNHPQIIQNDLQSIPSPSYPKNHLQSHPKTRPRKHRARQPRKPSCPCPPRTSNWIRHAHSDGSTKKTLGMVASGDQHGHHLYHLWLVLKVSIHHNYIYIIYIDRYMMIYAAMQ